MIRYTLRRLGGILVTLFFLSMFTFVLSRAIPGGPWDLGVEIPRTDEQIAMFKAKYGLDKPIWQQYLIWLRNAIMLDFGSPYMAPELSVTQLIWRQLPYSALVGGLAATLSIAFGIVFGMIAAARQKGGLSAGPVAVADKPEPAAPAGAAIRVRISLAPELQDQVKPEESLFIYARALQGPKMPLAAARHQVRDLPLELTLDDAGAMMPAMKLSNFEQVVVGARVSRTGGAIAQSGDLRGEISPVPVRDAGLVEVVIDSTVP